MAGAVIVTVTEKMRLRSASPAIIAGAVNVGLAADVSLRATVVPEV